jgi:hypothetical protein
MTSGLGAMGERWRPRNGRRRLFQPRIRRAHDVRIFGNPVTASRAHGIRMPDASALFFSQRNQNHDNAERCRNRGGGETDGRDFGARMKTFFQPCCKADQKE